MSDERVKELAREIQDTEYQIREMEKMLDESWYRALVKDGEEAASGKVAQLIAMPVNDIASLVQMLELRGELRGISTYGGIVEGRLESLKTTLGKLKSEYEDEPADSRHDSNS